MVLRELAGADGSPHHLDKLGLIEKAAFKTRLFKLGKERNKGIVWGD